MQLAASRSQSAHDANVSSIYPTSQMVRIIATPPQQIKESDMADKCDRCAVGIIGTKSILAGDWKAAEADFEKLIEDWNEKTKRFAIPHPGFARKFFYCPLCGSKVED
ncbi:hypothetical protein SG64_18600 [Enterobacter hormaechei subsp. xiangfangensis]|nr:hypothetical protein SG64_18600 [Enterobacter hormaechei subsp. xiangfangensis]